MKITVSRTIRHLCPYRDEVDEGTVTLEWEADEAPELHELRSALDYWHNRRITHEALTADIAVAYPAATVTTRWTTAGMEVECVVSRDESV